MIKTRFSLVSFVSVVVLVLHLILPVSALAPTPSPASGLPQTTTVNNPDDHNNYNSMAPPSAGRIKNFRNAAGIGNVYRCAATDSLGDEKNTEAEWSPADQFIFQEAGLILDLRSPSERKESQAQNWMQQAPGRPLQVVESNEYYSPSNSHDRFVVRVDVLSPPRFMAYVEDQWLSAAEKAQAAWFKVASGQKLHELRIQALNARGLAGLNEAILETGKHELRKALQTMTLHLESNPNDSIVIHCVQGKDRTGMLTMLLQSMLGMEDDEIVEDYYLSNQMLNGNNNDGSAAVRDVVPEKRRGRVSRSIFSGTNRQAMVTTLAFLRSKYGSVSPGYLDAIGFDAQWRSRLLAVLKTSAPPRSKL